MKSRMITGKNPDVTGLDTKNLDVIDDVSKKRKSYSKGIFSAKEMTLCGMFAVLIMIGAFIKIPVPVCPFTLQFFFTTMAGILLGGKLGAFSVLIYTLLGLCGLPVFAEGGGIGYVLKPTFGYMIGFILGSFVTGELIEKKKWTNTIQIFLASFAGLLIVYLVGMIYYFVLGNFVIGAPIGVWALILYCFILAVPGDIALCIIVSILAGRIRTSIKQLL